MLEFLGILALILVIIYLAWWIILGALGFCCALIFARRQAKHRRVMAELQADIDRRTKATFT